MRARTVAMAFFVSADGKLRDMRAHGVLRQIELHVGAALAPLTVVGELERVRVGHKIGRQEKSPGELALAVEVTFGARIEAVDKL